MNNAPEKSPSDEVQAQTLYELFWGKVEQIFANPSVHPCLGYRPYNWNSEEMFNAFQNHKKKDPGLKTTDQDLNNVASSKNSLK